SAKSFFPQFGGASQQISQGFVGLDAARKIAVANGPGIDDDAAGLRFEVEDDSPQRMPAEKLALNPPDHFGRHVVVVRLNAQRAVVGVADDPERRVQQRIKRLTFLWWHEPFEPLDLCIIQFVKLAVVELRYPTTGLQYGSPFVVTEVVRSRELTQG